MKNFSLSLLARGTIILSGIGCLSIGALFMRTASRLHDSQIGQIVIYGALGFAVMGVGTALMHLAIRYKYIGGADK